MTTRINEAIIRLSTAHLKRELFSFPSLGSDEVFEDDFDSLEKLTRADIPDQDFDSQDSVWESIVSYFWVGVGYFWRSSSVDSSQYNIGELL